MYVYLSVAPEPRGGRGTEVSPNETVKMRACLNREYTRGRGNQRSNKVALACLSYNRVRGNLKHTAEPIRSVYVSNQELSTLYMN